MLEHISIKRFPAVTLFILQISCLSVVNLKVKMSLCPRMIQPTTYTSLVLVLDASKHIGNNYIENNKKPQVTGLLVQIFPTKCTKLC